MANIIKIKRSETSNSIPTTSDIAVGEICMNIADQKLYTRKSDDSIVTVSDAVVGKTVLELISTDTSAAAEYDLNPFGKLIKAPARYHARGHIIEHKKYYHGFFANLRCTEEFYNKYKVVLDKYIVTEDHINRDSQPSWL